MGACSEQDSRRDDQHDKSDAFHFHSLINMRFREPDVFFRIAIRFGRRKEEVVERLAASGSAQKETVFVLPTTKFAPRNTGPGDR